MTQDPHSRQGNSRINGVAEPVSASDAPRALPEICSGLRRKVTAFLKEQTDDEALRNVQSQVRVSMGVIEEALRRYGPEQLSLSYNGGKDCLVLLVLILACLPAWTSSSGSDSTAAASSSNITSTLKTTNTTEPSPSTSEPQPLTLQAVYIVSPHPFPEVEDFVATSAAYYHLDLARYALPMRPALEIYLGEKTAVKAIFVGTRRTDPHGEFLTHFNPTDEDWPQCMRVHPIIDWHYTEIWAVSLSCLVPSVLSLSYGGEMGGGAIPGRRGSGNKVD
ncbi:MAG: 3'-phosphoadenosine 5'-phosphosulfate sulfotransferase [Geoglossum umbratile]|nr:MAG: 3'-phosphoadenosine 5'-phosphosulfate sulfotransferase [Geoglossum umbratile]